MSENFLALERTNIFHAVQSFSPLCNLWGDTMHPGESTIECNGGSRAAVRVTSLSAVGEHEWA